MMYCVIALRCTIDTLGCAFADADLSNKILQLFADEKSVGEDGGEESWQSWVS